MSRVLDCPTCGGPVTVQGDRREGTLHYDSVKPLLPDDDTAVPTLAVKLTSIIEARMSRDLAWTRDDGVTVERWDPERVGWGLAHLAVSALREGGPR